MYFNVFVACRTVLVWWAFFSNLLNMKRSSILILFSFLFLSQAMLAQVQLTNKQGWEYHPKWHPLYPNLFFYTYNDGNGCKIFCLDENTGQDIMVPLELNGALHFDFTPDGNYLIVDGYTTPEPPINIYSFNLNKHTLSLLIEHSGYPTVSPDGSKIAYAGPNQNVMIANIDGSNPQALTSTPGFYEVSDWSPDGSKLAITWEQNENSDIWIINSDGTGLTQLTTSTNRDFWPCWSPEGAKIAFNSVSSSGNFDIWLMASDGSNPTQLTTYAGVDNHPQWSEDGSEIIFSSDRDGTKDLWKISSTTSHIEKVEPSIKLKVFPNPATHDLHALINCESNCQATAILFSDSGQVIISTDMGMLIQGKNRTKIDIPRNLSSGYYFLTIKMGKENITRKIFL